LWQYFYRFAMIQMRILLPRHDSTGCSRKNRTNLVHRNFMTVIRRVTRFSLKCSEIIRKHNKGQGLNTDAKYSLFKAWRVNYSKNINIISAIHDRNSLQQAQITELTKTKFKVSTVRMNEQQQSFRPLVNSNVDSFLADHVPAAVQDLFQMVDVLNL